MCITGRVINVKNAGLKVITEKQGKQYYKYITLTEIRLTVQKTIYKYYALIATQ